MTPQEKFEQAITSKVITNEAINEIKSLLKNPEVNPAAFDNEAIRWAADMGNLDLVKLLLEDERVNPSAYEYFALEQSCYHGYVEIVKLLLEHKKTTPNKYNNKALIFAISGKNSNIISLLLNHKKFNYLFHNDYREKLEYIFFEGIKNDYIDFIKFLPKDKDFDLSFLNNILIQSADIIGNIEIMKLAWQDERVKILLKKDNALLYNKLKKIDNIKDF